MSIGGMDPKDILTLGYVWGILSDGAAVARTKGFDVDLTQWFADDGLYERFIDVTVDGRTIRLEAKVVDDEGKKVNPPDDLVDLLDELRPHN